MAARDRKTFVGVVLVRACLLLTLFALIVFVVLQMRSSRSPIWTMVGPKMPMSALLEMFVIATERQFSGGGLGHSHLFNVRTKMEETIKNATPTATATSTLRLALGSRAC